MEELPREDDPDGRIKTILVSGFTISQKAYQIQAYYQSLIPYNRTPGRKQGKPELNHFQISDILKERGVN